MNDLATAFDFTQMFLGDEPPLFLLEIVFRTLVIYIYTLVLIRWIGSRSIAQLSLVEFLLVIALGSAVGDAMFYPDVPLLHCVVVITVVVLLDKGLSFLVARSPWFEDAVEGRTVEIVRDGLIRWHEIERLNFGHDELFEQLRYKDVENLGQVRAAYVETNGLVSVFKTERNERRGLSINPPWDVREPQRLRAGEQATSTVELACPRCAMLLNASSGTVLTACPQCAGEIWHVQAIDG